MVMVVVNEKGEGRMNEKGEVEKLRSVPVALVDWLAGPYAWSSGGMGVSTDLAPWVWEWGLGLEKRRDRRRDREREIEDSPGVPV